MLARWSLVIVFAATCGLLCALAVLRVGLEPDFNEGLDGEDEVSLLQERVLERHLSKKLTDTKPAVEETSVPNVCDDAVARVNMLRLVDLDDSNDEPQPAREAPAIEIEALADDMEVGGALSASTERFARILRCVLDFFIGLLLLDRCRCWYTRSCKGDSGDEASSSGKAESFLQMMRALAVGDKAGAREMLLRGASVTDKDFWGCTPLHAAAKAGCTQLAAELLDLGAEVDASDSWEETPLHVACRAGHVHVCEALLSKGANVDALSAQSFTPLVVAGSAERSAVVLMLLQKGAGLGELAKQDLPPLLQELLVDSKEKLLEGVEIQMEAESGDVCQWPTDEDWEEHMQESMGTQIRA